MAASDYVGVTRDGFAKFILELVIQAEGRQIDTMDRTYLLDLTRDVVAAVDGNRKKAKGAEPPAIANRAGLVA